MALTRVMLKELGISPELIDKIIDAHIETVNALKDERDGLKDKVEKLSNAQKELDDLKAEQSKNDYKGKFENLQKDFDKFKAEQTEKETKAAKEHAFRELLKSINVSEKRFDSIVKITSLDDLELAENGKFKDEEKLTESLKNEWADFISKKSQEGAKTPNPANAGGAGKTMTKADILAIKDRTEQRKAISENMELFGLGGKND